MPYVIALEDDRYVTILPLGQASIVTGGNLTHAHVFEQKDDALLKKVLEMRPAAKFVEVVVNSDGTIRLGTKMMQPKFVDPRREEAWMAIQELRAFAMACDADERSIQPHEILDRLPTRGN